MAAVQAINTVCLVSFLASCIKHCMAVADYSWDLFPYTCWVGEIQVNGGTLAGSSMRGRGNGVLLSASMSPWMKGGENRWTSYQGLWLISVMCIKSAVTSRLIYCLSQAGDLHEADILHSAVKHCKLLNDSPEFTLTKSHLTIKDTNTQQHFFLYTKEFSRRLLMVLQLLKTLHKVRCF